MEKLGTIIRTERKKKKITLVELAKMTGVAQASLSRIETGVMTGTVESHKRISEALGISLAELYDGIDTRVDTIDKQEGAEETVTYVDDTIKIEVLTTNIAAKKIVPFLYTISPLSQTNSEKLERGVERFFFVVAGTVKVVVKDREFFLSTRGTLYFDASLPHHIVNATDSQAMVLCATSPSRI